MKPFIIAEIGVNHDGNIRKAKELICVAKDSGANAVKFQTFIPEKLALPNTPKVNYQKIRDRGRSHFEMLKALVLTYDEHIELRNFCLEKNIEFMSTPYGLEELDFLNELGIEKIKIASADIVDLPLHEAASKTGKLSIVSTGMATRAEILEVVSIYTAQSSPIVLMQCTSEYPSSIKNANLLKLKFLQSLEVVATGYSDHTRDSKCALVALGLGASYFEKHLTLRNSDPGPDHAASAEPNVFEEYVSSLHEGYDALGITEPLMTDQELEMRLVSRKSLHYRSSLPRNSKLEINDLVLTRPGTGLKWSEMDLVVGKKLLRAVNEGEMASIEDFELEVE